MAPHSESPALRYLILLVFEAVLEVVCVSLPGYIIAKQGMFNPEMQKFVANLNVSLFTPCLSEFALMNTLDNVGGGLANVCGDSFHETCIAVDSLKNR